MEQDFDREIAAASHFWQPGNYVLHHWRDKADDILLDCMIYDINERLVVRIEDDRRSYALKKRMKDAGVPVIRELPPGKNILEQAIEEFMNVGMDSDEIANAHEELKKMYEAGMSRAALEQRLAEVIGDYSNKPNQGP
jgi:hypothetical protein